MEKRILSPKKVSEAIVGAGVAKVEKRILSPKEVSEAIVGAGVAKATKSSLSLVLLGVLAGMFIAFGAVGAIIMGALHTDPGVAKFMGAAVFPVGLMLVVMAGAELFTGNNLMTIALMDKKIGVKGLLKNWSLVFIGNFIGSVIVAFLVFKGNVFSGAVADKAVAIATGKVGLAFDVAIFKAILCNILVVLAVWLATAAKDMTGKIFACWFPIMLFVLSGFEHSIANMFFLYVGKYYGAAITTSEIWVNNLLPVTLGNLIGGAMFIPVMYYFIL